MKIVVAYKWAPNPQDASVGADGVVDWGRAKPAVSEYDPVAVELGRVLADATGAELIGISVGGADAGSPMARKAALSRGLDRAVILADDALAGADTTRTGLALAALVQRIGDVDLVLTGDSSVDVGAQLVPAVLAGALGWPALTGVTAVSGAAGSLTVERGHDGGSQTLALTGPAVLAVAADAVQPRVPGMKDILAAGKRPAEVLDTAAVPVPPGAVQVIATAPPELKARRGQVIDAADPAAAAAELVAALRADAVI
ncbi:electron transfer flavoprotein subunit beta/FixA family protein [Cellulomonas denverensis]|uniref:Electron transfer flavoprotein small subunit n=1 Tax=Cellulomonas denverensis TaxID=264297 RepID=A0A7X6KWC4_9CELL|nr:electron transfer flavoprotein beta subunit/FixA family protein [Cellulomonas denverensis]NKY23358.1 electron transfer flavoprotein beta subunit/FixA family protein [Cellulomonas denverensis]GIG24353.1 electron transfer flavoprotein FixB [Cellulomonas denverensis]